MFKFDKLELGNMVDENGKLWFYECTFKKILELSFQPQSIF